jgi:two-component system response regulator FixJ
VTADCRAHLWGGNSPCSRVAGSNAEQWSQAFVDANLESKKQGLRVQLSDQPTIYIVDDDPDVRDSLRLLLESSDFMVETFDSAATFLTAARVSNACLVTDVRMPGMDGMALQEELARMRDAMPVIVMTGHGDVPLAVKAMRAGAIDFLEKPFDETALVTSVKRAIEDRSLSLGRHAATQSAREQLSHLTERERQVLDLLVLGKPNKVIAHELRISPRTVEIHRARVMEKMKARSLADLVRVTLAAKDEGQTFPPSPQ